MRFRDSAHGRSSAGRSYVRQVLALFLLSSLLPVLVLSGVMTWLSSGVLQDVTEANAEAGLEECAVRLEEFTHRLSRRAVALAADPAVLLALDEGGSGPADAAALVMRRIRFRFPYDEAPLDVSIVSAGGKRRFSTREYPSDYDPGKYGQWGIIRKISARPAGIAIMAKAHRLVKENYTALSVGTAVLGASGRPVGFVIIDIPRETLRSALAPLPRLPELIIADDSGCIALSISSPEREGSYLEDLEYGADTVRTVLTGGSLSLVGSLPSDFVERLESMMRLVTLVCLFACVLLAVFVSLFLSRSLSRPIAGLIEATRRVSGGDLSVRLVPAASGEIAALMTGFNSMISNIGGLLEKTVEEQELLKKAELDTLSSQINPHFFFNALSSINALAKLGRCAEIVTVTTALGRLLRANAEGGVRLSTIGESLVETRNYLAIEKIRFGDRFSWTEDVDPVLLDCEIPRLSIQSLVENALTHGIEPRPGASSLRITVQREGSDVCIRIEDDGAGMTDAVLEDYSKRLSSGQAVAGTRHIGLLNTNRRIRLEYGDRYGLSLCRREGGGTVATILLPWRRAVQCTV